MANRQPEGDVFGSASLRRELKEARDEADQAKTYLAGVLVLIQARTGDYQLTDRFCIKCHKQYLHSGPDNCECICHRATEFMKEHPTIAQIAAANELAEQQKAEAAALAAARQEEGQADDAEQTQT
jgi:hypothetical protein